MLTKGTTIGTKYAPKWRCVSSATQSVWKCHFDLCLEEQGLVPVQARLTRLSRMVGQQSGALPAPMIASKVPTKHSTTVTMVPTRFTMIELRGILQMSNKLQYYSTQCKAVRNAALFDTRHS